MDVYVIIDTQDVTAECAFKSKRAAEKALEAQDLIKIMDSEYAVDKSQWKEGVGYSIQKVEVRK